MTLQSDQTSAPRSPEQLWRSRVSVARLAAISGPALRVTQALLLAVTVGLIFCLWLGGAQYERKWWRWRWLDWLGDGGDQVPVVLVTAVIALLCILTYWLRRNRSSAAVPVMIVVGLTATSLVLGLSSYWRCINANHPTFIAPLLW